MINLKYVLCVCVYQRLREHASQALNQLKYDECGRLSWTKLCW